MKRPTALLLGLFLATIGISSDAFADVCENPRTQIDKNSCAYADLERETKKLNKTYNNYRTKLDQVQKQQLKEVQLAWIKFKDLACKYSASGVEGGSVYPTILAGCLAKQTQQRNKELEALANCQEGDMGC
jgi:uncharacterized protein YecT (DUF1311 family)